MSRSQLLSKPSSKSFIFQEAWPFGAFLLAKAPTPRINFSIAYSYPSSKIFLYGGEDETHNTIYDDLFSLQVKPTKLWASPSLNAKTRPPPIANAASVSVDSKMYMFGGRTKDGLSDELYVLNEVTNFWSSPRVVGQKPSPRYGHTLHSFNLYTMAQQNKAGETHTHDILILFGGKGENGVCFNDVFTFSLRQYDKHKWTKRETTGPAPCPRYLHSAVIVDSILYVFGGLDANNKFLNDLYAFDINSATWTEIIADGSQYIPPRAGHSCIAYTVDGNDMLLHIFGGQNESGPLEDSYVFDTTKRCWYTSVEPGKKPSARYGHRMIMIDSTTAYLLGGYPYDNPKSLDILIFYPLNSKLTPPSTTRSCETHTQKTRSEIENEYLLKQQQENLAKLTQMEEKRKKELQEYSHQQEKIVTKYTLHDIPKESGTAMNVPQNSSSPTLQEQKKQQEEQTKKTDEQTEPKRVVQQMDEHKRKEEEQMRLEEERRRKLEDDEKRLLDEYRRKLAEVRRQIEEETRAKFEFAQRQLEEEKKKMEEEMKRKLAIQQQQIEEERKKIEEERRKNEEKKKKEEEEKKFEGRLPSKSFGAFNSGSKPFEFRSESSSRPTTPHHTNESEAAVDLEKTRQFMTKLLAFFNESVGQHEDKYYAQKYKELEAFVRVSVRDFQHLIGEHILKKPSTPKRPAEIEKIVMKESVTSNTQGTNRGPKISSPHTETVHHNAETNTTRETPKEREDEKFAKRKRIFIELIETEENYVKDLHMVEKKFIEPISEKQLLTPQEVQEIFANIGMLAGLNDVIYKELSAMKDNPPKQQLAGHIFVRLADYFRMYTQYCANHDNARMRLEALKKENPKFNKFLEDKLNDPDCRALDLAAFLITPVQRICRYPLLLKELLKHTPKDHPDHDDLETAIARVESIVADVNEHQRITENAKKLAKIVDNIYWDKIKKPQGFDLIDPRRHFLRQANFEIVESLDPFKVSEKKVVAFLFNDVLLLAKEKEKDHFHVRAIFWLVETLAWNVKKLGGGNEDPKYKERVFGIQKLPNGMKQLFAAANLEEREDWVSTINECCQKLQPERPFSPNTDREKKKKK